MPARLLAHYATVFTPSQRLLQLSGDEALCHYDRYQLDCLSPDAGLALKTLLGLQASINVLLANGGFARYRLTIEAAFSLLRHRRVFQDIRVPDIGRQLLIEEHRTCDQEYILQLANGTRYPIPVVSEYRHAGHGEACCKR